MHVLLVHSFEHVANVSLQSWPWILPSLGRRSFISQSALAEVLTAVRESGELRQAALVYCEALPYIGCSSRDPILARFFRPWKLRTRMVQRSSIHFAHPAAFMHITIYLDEIGPLDQGNQLKVHNKGKMWTVCIKEFGGFELTDSSIHSVHDGDHGPSGP